jgi:hypothetical protein
MGCMNDQKTTSENNVVKLAKLAGVNSHRPEKEPKLVEQLVNSNDNRMTHRTVATLGSAFGDLRRKLGPLEQSAFDKLIKQELANAHSVPVSLIRPRMSLRLISTEPPQRAEGTEPDGC